MTLLSAIVTAAILGAAAVGAVRVNGDVFIVTEAGQNIKLGLVEVQFTPEKLMQKTLEQQIGSLRKKYPDLQSKAGLLSLEASTAKLKAKTAELKASIEQNTELRQKLLRESIEEHTKQQDSAEQAAALEAEIRKFTSGKILIENLPRASKLAKTDADGKFSISLKPGKYAVAAAAGRKREGAVEEYAWLIWVTITSDADQRIFLSNDNLFEANPTTSILRSDVLTALINER